MRQIPSSHPVRVEATPDNPITLLNRGDTFYYGQTSAVSSTTNDGSVVAGATLGPLTVPTWVRSASQSYVDDLPSVANDDSRISRPTFNRLASGAFLTSSIDTTITPLTVTVVTWDTVIADNGGYWNPDHPTRLTVPYTGLYFLHGNIEFLSHNQTDQTVRLVYFRRNGRTSGFDPDSVDTGHSETYVPRTDPTTDTPQVHAKAATVLQAGDYVEMFAYHDTDGDVTTRHVRPNTPQFAVFYHGPATVSALP